MIDKDIVYDLACLSFKLVMSSKYVNEMFIKHNISCLPDFNSLGPTRLHFTDSFINVRDPECETGFAIAFDCKGHYPIISVNTDILSKELSIFEISDMMEIVNSFVKSMLHETRHLVQFYETCIQTGSIARGIETYTDISRYVIEKYPWPFTPLENDALNTMYTIDPFNDFYDSSITPLIQKLIMELSDREEED